MIEFDDNKEYCWSVDDEEYRYTEFDDLVNSEELEVGQTVYYSEIVRVEAKDVFNIHDVWDIVSNMADRMWDTVGECAEDWGEVKPEEANELMQFIQAWIERVDSPNRFYKVKTPTQQYVITEEDLE